LSTPFNYRRVDESSFEFITENGITYRASFTDASGHFSHAPQFASQVKGFQFLVTHNPLSHLPADERVGSTISFIILQFFEQSPEGILFFIHESADGKQHGRKRKFDAWYSRSASASLIKLDASIPIGRYSILASLLFRRAHLQREEILAGFDRLILEATEKPED
jgi:Family of unknown function (DUF6169)